MVPVEAAAGTHVGQRVASGTRDPVFESQHRKKQVHLNPVNNRPILSSVSNTK